MSGGSWKGLAAELQSVDANDAAAPGTVAQQSTPAAAEPTTASSASPVLPGNAAADPRRRRSKAKFTDTHRLVGVYFPHDLDAAFRQAAEEDGLSNSELVVLAVRAYLSRR